MKSDVTHNSLELRSPAASIAAAFDCSSWAKFAGLWHDLGKYRSGFQKYLCQSHDVDACIEGRLISHDANYSVAGSLWAHKCRPDMMPKHDAVLDHLFGGLTERLARDNVKREISDALCVQPPQDILRPRLPHPAATRRPVVARRMRRRG